MSVCRTFRLPPSNTFWKHVADPQISAQMRAYDFHKVIDNSLVDRLVKEGFFESLFGPEIKAEEDRKTKLAFR